MSDFLKKDRISKYFKQYLRKFLFVEFSDEFMKKLRIDDITKGVRVPIMPEDLQHFAGGEGVSATKIAENMVWVVGCDPNFKFAEDYKKFMKRFFNDQLSKDVLMMGVSAIEHEDYENACIHFRAALFLEPNMLEALYNYARVCREMYMNSEDAEYIGWFKAESIDAFEQLTIDHPDFDQPYYFLGYAYLNLGLYEKAGLAWEKFMTKSKDTQIVAEVSQRLRQISEPRKIEEGCNHVISGRYQEGLNILISFLGSNYDTWWPLHFYLGIAYEELGNDVMAAEEYKTALKYNAANLDSIDGLIRIYTRTGNEVMVNKYKQKKEIIKHNLEEDAKDR